MPKLEGLGKKVVTGVVNQVVSYDPINLSHLRRMNVSNNPLLGTIAIQSRTLTLATCKHNPKLTGLTLFCEGLKALDVSGCQRLGDKGLHKALKFYQVLPRLNIDNCPAIHADLWHWMAHVSQQAVSCFPKWAMNAWQQSVLSLLPYASDSVVDIDCETIEPNQVALAMRLVTSNLDAHTILVNLPPKNIATTLTLLLILLKSNHNIVALCITGASLDTVMAEQVITAVAQCPHLGTMALSVDNSQLAIAQLQQVRHLAQVMINGVNITSLLQAGCAMNRAAIANDVKGQQAMVVDVLALAMQHEAASVRQATANTLALLSATGKLSECKQQTTALLSGENPTPLTVQPEGGVIKEKEKEREKEEASDSDNEHVNIAEPLEQIGMGLG